MSDERFAEELRGFGPLGILAIVVIFAASLLGPLFTALLVLAWAARSRTPWDELGFVRPGSWPGVVIAGVAFGVALKVLLKVIVMPLLQAHPTNEAYQFLVGNEAAALTLALQVIVVAGFGEETFFRGYLFERVGKLFGRSVGAKVAIVLATSAFFGVLHFREQGLDGVKQATVVGLVFGTIFAATGRIWLLMIAHAAFDLTAIAIIYWNLETVLARLVFP